MDNLEISVSIIKTLGGAASTEQIVNEYCSMFNAIQEPSYKAIFEAILKSNPSTVIFDKETNKWFLTSDWLLTHEDVETQHNRKRNPQKIGHSELRQHVTRDAFENAFRRFIEQASINAKTGLAKGERYPLGSKSIDDAGFSQHFGFGGASKTPYMNWWVVSIYYVVDTEYIVLGIEDGRYPYLKEMKPVSYEQIGKKKTNVAVFYKVRKELLDFDKLYQKFIEVSEEVMSLGLK